MSSGVKVTVCLVVPAETAAVEVKVKLPETLVIPLARVASASV